MAHTIHKFPLPVADFPSIEMPAGSRVLTVQMQSGRPCVWAVVNTEHPKVRKRFRVAGTGHELTANPGEYVGTFQMNNGALVFHLFCLGE